MRPLNAPAFDYRALYLQVAASVKNVAERGLLHAMEGRIMTAALAYDAAMAAGRPEGASRIALSDHEEFVASTLYTQRISRKGAAGRWAYEAIRYSQARCPYCLDGEVWQVDHYLPQAAHQDVCAYPANLVPICSPCNHLKRELEPGAAGTSFLHPYFDRIPAVRWLFARLEFEADGPVLLYSASLPAAHGGIAARLGFHFTMLRLSERFRPRAAKVLIELQEDVRDLFALAGAAGLRAHFRAEAERLFSRDGNTIEMAAYHAAADSDHFCEGAYGN